MDARRPALLALCTALAFALFGASGCAITKQIDEHTFEIRGNADKVDAMARRTCEPTQVPQVTQLDYKPERTGSSVIGTQQTSRSCDSYGSCTSTTTTSSTPITLTIPAQQRVRVRCW